MTHTNHRIGEYLEEDYVVLVMPSRGINVQGSGQKLWRYLEMALENGAIKIGDARLGNEYHQGGVEKVLDNLQDQAVVHAVFKDKDSLVKTLRAYKEADLGLSVVVSGLFDHVGECCKKVGLERHTINQSMGRWGKTEKLPPPEILQLNTMCGHGMVAVGLINEVINDIKTGDCTVQEGAERLFAPCMCGIFNPHRAALILKDLTEN
ncbi:MAG: hypothetical protein JRH18_12420 [Deltaproteobacteria bacterium]|nr:hypothetical protein [Deltaproteobacteria bacterium]MBW1961792.1 hypothetical protein [Deltaproteobacteria bacterium]MBW1993455.1 hypothetical protein [Deltaproteobacteria bacterium]MBW2152461.1 hypothetical protein [Deltaproteobacteria bacterium]